MKETKESQRGSRREFLLVFGGAVLSLPLLGCTPEEAEPPPTSDNDPSDQGTDDPVPPDQPASELGQQPDQVGGQAPEQAGEQTQTGQESGQEPSPPPSADMPKLEESDAMAQALGYKHDASEVSLEQFPSRGEPGSANEFCHNCVHFQAPAGGDSQWAPCTIFPGKLVNADGWCSAWAAKA